MALIFTTLKGLHAQGGPSTKTKGPPLCLCYGTGVYYAQGMRLSFNLLNV